MTHIAIVEQLDGKNADWLEKVSDAISIAIKSLCVIRMTCDGVACARK
jgi:hypothetical protein